jgi:hypothetical protein
MFTVFYLSPPLNEQSWLPQPDYTPLTRSIIITGSLNLNPYGFLCALRVLPGELSTGMSKTKIAESTLSNGPQKADLQGKS